MRYLAKVFLVGMPGSGKSTLGREAARLGRMLFFDLDEEIERSEGRSIKEIFEQDGEPYFRQLEKDKLEELTRSNDDFILSTGGGAPCFHNNMDFINRNGRSIFVNVPLQELRSRLLQTNLAARPKIGNVKNLGDHLEKTWSERLPIYQMAHEEVNGVGAGAADLLRLLR